MRVALLTLRPKRSKTISLTKIRDNDNEKVLIAALIAGFSLSATAAQTIRFATEASYPPFESMDANNKIVGFDVDRPTRYVKRSTPPVPLPIRRSTA